MIPCQRDLFDIPEDVAYLNCAYMSPLMHSVREAGAAAVSRKARPWNISPPDFFDESEEGRGLFARLIGASPEDVAIVPAVSYGIAVAAANVRIEPGQRIIILAEQFPSNVYAWRELASANGAEVVTIARPEDHDWTGAVLSAIDERTALAALPYNHWTDGGLIDLVRIGAALHAVGAALVLDVTQSLGALPFDVSEVRPDYVVCATYKWLLGPYSFGFLYVAPEHHEGRPLEHGWIARKNSQDFAGLVDYRDGFQPGARRFDVGERSNFVLLPMALAALRQILEWDVAKIQATLRATTDNIAARASRLGLTAMPPEFRAGHFLGLRFPGGVPANLLDRLAADQIFVSVRGDSMRVTPHLYNTATDIDRLFEVLEKQ